MDYRLPERDGERDFMSPTDRMIARTFGLDDCEYDVVIREGEEWYAFAGMRASIGAFDIVAIDWEHPNVGYLTDGMLWIRSFSTTDWQPYPVAGWTEQYRAPQDLLKEFPQFAPLFRDDDDAGMDCNHLDPDGECYPAGTECPDCRAVIGEWPTRRHPDGTYD